MTRRGSSVLPLAVVGVILTGGMVQAVDLVWRTRPAPSGQSTPAADAAAALTLEQKEAFLEHAKIVRTRTVSVGVTGTVRATLTDGTITHDASIQTIDEYKAEFRSKRGTEFNFRDSWRYNVAAYRLDRLLELGMIPPSVERRHDNKPGAFTWWVDDVIMDEGKRIKDRTQPPPGSQWNEQMWHVRLFDQLIHNVDRNLGNLLIDRDWKIWMIDHSRAFRTWEKLRNPENLSRCDRALFERLKALDEATVQAAVGDYLTAAEVRALLARRTIIVEMLEKAGGSALFDWKR